MKTLTRLLQTAAVAALLGAGTAALADPYRNGPSRDFGERPGYGHGHGGMVRHHEARGWGGGHWLPAPVPFVAWPRLFLPPLSVRLPPLPVPPFIVRPVVVPRLTVTTDCFWPPAPPVVYVRPAPVVVHGCGGPVRVVIRHPTPAW